MVNIEGGRGSLYKKTLNFRVTCPLNTILSGVICQRMSLKIRAF